MKFDLETEDGKKAYDKYCEETNTDIALDYMYYIYEDFSNYEQDDDKIKYRNQGCTFELETDDNIKITYIADSFDEHDGLVPRVIAVEIYEEEKDTED